MKALRFGDVAVGQEIPSLVKRPTTLQLVRWAGASGDYNPIHYDKDYAVARGLPGVVVQGQLTAAFLGQLLTDWLGPRGNIKKFSVSYKGMNFPGGAITCRGVVTKKESMDGQGLVTLDIWAENERGEKTATGLAQLGLGGR